MARVDKTELILETYIHIETNTVIRVHYEKATSFKLSTASQIMFSTSTSRTSGVRCNKNKNSN